MSNGPRALARVGVFAALHVGGGSTLDSSTIEPVVPARWRRGIGDGIRSDDPAVVPANGGDTAPRTTISRSINHDGRGTASGTGTAGSANTWVSGATYGVAD